MIIISFWKSSGLNLCRDVEIPDISHTGTLFSIPAFARSMFKKSINYSHGHGFSIADITSNVAEVISRFLVEERERERKSFETYFRESNAVKKLMEITEEKRRGWTSSFLLS